MGAATLGADSMSGVIKPKKQKMVKTPMPSYEDYLAGYMNTMMGGGPKKGQGSYTALMGGGPVLGKSGQFYYGKAPEKIPQGSMVLRGPDVNYQTADKWSGSTNKTMPTFQVVQMAAPVSQGTPTEKPQLSLDLTRGGKANVLNRADIKYAKEQGATRKEIRQAVETGDIRMSARAKARLYKENKDKKATTEQV